ETAIDIIVNHTIRQFAISLLRQFATSPFRQFAKTMRHFRFRLERVLRYRETREEVALRTLREAIRRRLEHEHAIQRLRHACQQLASMTLTPEEWLQRERTLQALQARLQAMEELLPLLQEQEQQAREAYQEARRQREALARLRARAYDQFQQELSHLLQRETDEVVAYAYQRTASENHAAHPGDSDAD
ncbi:MAG: flagellar FliJ family protein, partial [Fimbriimonadales bacterium]|nr:flagellar FliJ family protein [Fimbriimonadales bacterium]